MSRLQEQYKNELHGQIMQKLGLKNAMEVPRITKITLNMGVGEAVADKKVLDKAVRRPGENCRSEGAGHTGSKVCCDVQDS